MTKARGWSDWNKPTLRVSHSHFLGGNLAGRGGFGSLRDITRKRACLVVESSCLSRLRIPYSSEGSSSSDQISHSAPTSWERERDSQRAGGLVSPLSSPKPPFFLSATDRSSEEKPGCAAQSSGFFLIFFFYLPPSFFSFMYFCRISAARVPQRIR